MTTDRERTAELLTELQAWIHEPTGLPELRSLLDGFDNVALAGVILASTDVRVGRIAMCELAVRKGLFEFELSLTRTDGTPGSLLEFRAGAGAVSTVKLKAS